MAIAAQVAKILLRISVLLIIVIVVFGGVGPLNNIRYPLLVAVISYLAHYFGAKDFLGKEELERWLRRPTFIFHYFFVLSALFVRVKYCDWRALRISGVDFSHIDYAIWNTWQGRFMLPSITEHSSYLDFFGNHWSPILYLYVAARAMFDHPFTSVFVHAISLALPVFPIFFLAKEKFTNLYYPLAFVVIYSFAGITASTLQFDIHFESFYIFGFLTLLYFLTTSRFSRTNVILGVLGSTLFCLSIKEDAGVYIAGVGLYFALFVSTRRLVGLSLFVCGLLYSWVAIKLLMPLHQPAVAATQTYYLPMWQKYGDSFGDILLGMARNPQVVLADMFFNKSYLKQLISFALLPIFSPALFLSFAPLFIASTASSAAQYFGLYYGAPLLPFLLFGAMDGLRRIQRRYSLTVANYFLLFTLAYALFVGGSYLRFFPASNLWSEIDITNDWLRSRLSQETTSSTVLIQGGLLPYIQPYSDKYKRLEDISAIAAGGSIILSKDLSMAPSGHSFGEVISYLESADSFSKNKSFDGRILIFERKE